MSYEPQPFDPSPASKPVPLCHVRDPFEGQLLVSLLQAEGMPAFCQNETAWQMLWHMGPAITPKGLPVMVRQADMPRARELLAEHDRDSIQAESPKTSDETTAWGYESCDQRDVRRGFWAGVIFLFSLIGMPLSIYAIYLLWRGRRAWHDPNQELRRRARRRIVIGMAFNLATLAMLGAVLFLIHQALFKHAMQTWSELPVTFKPF